MLAKAIIILYYTHWGTVFNSVVLMQPRENTFARVERLFHEGCIPEQG